MGLACTALDISSDQAPRLLRLDFNSVRAGPSGEEKATVKPVSRQLQSSGVEADFDAEAPSFRLRRFSALSERSLGSLQTDLSEEDSSDSDSEYRSEPSIGLREADCQPAERLECPGLQAPSLLKLSASSAHDTPTLYPNITGPAPLHGLLR